MHEDPFGIKPLKPRAIQFYTLEFSEDKIIHLAREIESTKYLLGKYLNNEYDPELLNKLENLMKLYRSISQNDISTRRNTEPIDRLHEKGIQLNLYKKEVALYEIEKGINGVEF